MYIFHCIFQGKEEGRDIYFTLYFSREGGGGGEILFTVINSIIVID